MFKRRKNALVLGSILLGGAASAIFLKRYLGGSSLVSMEHLAINRKFDLLKAINIARNYLTLAPNGSIFIFGEALPQEIKINIVKSLMGYYDSLPEWAELINT